MSTAPMGPAELADMTGQEIGVSSWIEVGQQREGQVAVRDRAAGRALLCRAFDIDVNPLTGVGAGRELVAAPLGDFDPP